MDLLRECFRRTMQLHPFSMPACVILPDHLNAIWTLPEGDGDYSTRWQLIKSAFTRRFSGKERYGVSPSRAVKGEQAVWQRRFWAHFIPNQTDLKNHVEYIHFNPVKHGLVEAPVKWPYSSFHMFVKNGLYSEDWGKQGGGLERVPE